MQKFKTPVQDREVSIRREELRKQKILSDGKKESAKPYVSVKKFALKNQPDKLKQNEINIRTQNRLRESELSRRKAESQQMVDLGVIEPIQDTRNFGEKQNDFYLQQRNALSNAKQIINGDDEEANRLITYLRNSNLFNEFNNQFPRIYREIKTNYNSIGAYEAFQEIRRILNEVDNKDDFRPITTNVFKKGVQGLIQLMSSQMQIYENTNQQMYRQIGRALLKLEALQTVRDDTSNKIDFDQQVGLNEETISELKEAVEQGQNPNETELLQNIEEGVLNAVEEDEPKPEAKAKAKGKSRSKKPDNLDNEEDNQDYINNKINSVPNDLLSFNKGHADILTQYYENNKKIVEDKLANIKGVQTGTVKTLIKSKGVDGLIDDVFIKQAKELARMKKEEEAQAREQAKAQSKADAKLEAKNAKAKKEVKEIVKKVPKPQNNDPYKDIGKKRTTRSSK